MTADQKDAFEERAAILEFDAGMTRREAERIAAEQMGLTEDDAEFMQGVNHGE